MSHLAQLCRFVSPRLQATWLAVCLLELLHPLQSKTGDRKRRCVLRIRGCEPPATARNAICARDARGLEFRNNVSLSAGSRCRAACTRLAWGDREALPHSMGTPCCKRFDALEKWTLSSRASGQAARRLTPVMPVSLMRTSQLLQPSVTLPPCSVQISQKPRIHSSISRQQP